MKNVIRTLGYVAIAVAFIFLSIESWKLRRYVNYKWSYQNVVQQEIGKQIKPLDERIQRMEIEIEILKTNSIKKD